MKNKRQIFITTLSVLVSVFLVAGVAMATTTVGLNINTGGTADIESYAAIGNGSALSANNGLIVDYDTTYTAAGAQVKVLGTVTNLAATNAYGVQIAPQSITNISGTTALIASLYVDEPTITVTAGTVTNASTVYIAGAPTEGTNNYALFAQGPVTVGTAAGATGVALTGADPDQVLQAHGVIATAATSGAFASNYNTMTITAAQTNNVSVFGSWSELYLTGDITLGGSNYGATWGNLEISGTIDIGASNITTPTYSGAVVATVIAPATMTVPAYRHLAGVIVDSNLTTGYTSDATSEIAGVLIRKSNTKAVWPVGLRILGDSVTTGIDIGGGSAIQALKVGTLSSSTPGSGAIVNDSVTKTLEVNADDNNTTRLTATLNRAIAGRLMIYADTSSEDWGIDGLSKVSAVAKTANVSAGVVGRFESTGVTSVAAGNNSYIAGVMGRIGTSATVTLASDARAAAVLAFGNNSATFGGSGKYVGVLVVNTAVGTPEDFDYGFELQSDAAATGIKLGTVSATGIDIGTATTGIALTGTQTTGIDMSSGTITTDITLSNSATIVSTDANTLTITEPTIAFVGGVTTADTFTSATGGENAMTVTVTDSQDQTSGMSRGIVVAHTVSGAKSGTADSEGINVDMTLSGNTNDVFGTGVYIADSGNKNHGGTFGSQVYIENLGSGTISTIVGSYIGINSTNLATGRHTALRLVNHSGTAKSAILLEGGWTTGIDLSGVGGGGTQTTVGTDIRLSSSTTISSGATNPASCVKGSIFLNTTTGALNVCETADNWTAK